jgi:hypothetical protein
LGKILNNRDVKRVEFDALEVKHTFFHLSQAEMASFSTLERGKRKPACPCPS